MRGAGPMMLKGPDMILHFQLPDSNDAVVASEDRGCSGCGTARTNVVEVEAGELPEVF